MHHSAELRSRNEVVQYGLKLVRPRYRSALDRLVGYRAVSKRGGVGIVGKGYSGRSLRRMVRLSRARVTFSS
jgi:hypothetical protein